MLVAAVLTLACILPARGLIARQSNSTKSSLSKDEADQNRYLHSCLAGKRIVFIGPSTSKFDYLAMTYFAEYGVWPLQDQVKIGAAATDVGPNPLYEWNIRNEIETGGLPADVTAAQFVAGCNGGGPVETFMRYTNRILNGHEVCDCHQNGNWKGVGDLYNSTENRVYTNGNTMISYFQWLGDTVPPRGSFAITPAMGQPPAAVGQTCPAGQFPGTWAWQSPMAEFLTNVVQWAKPTHVVVSAAFWPSPLTTMPFWDQLATAGAASVSQSAGQVFWRTTPMRNDHPPTDPSSLVDRTRFLNNGWKIFDAQDIYTKFQGARPAKDLFYDFTHLKPEAASHLMQSFLQQTACLATPAVAAFNTTKVRV